ncbi:MTAP family purine nucleoside phosphorylase [Polaromonas sp. P2-4]|nr:MTAP family purine nucleoside phosphorylase [Polaromonas sp. P2-4]
MTKALVGIIGGSGLYQMDALENAQEHVMDTPFGVPSDVLVTGSVHGVPAVFLARHARGHRLLPFEVPYRANIHAMKQLGVRYLVSVSAVGSLREGFKPLDMVLPDQFIDLTKRRDNTFSARARSPMCPWRSRCAPPPPESWHARCAACWKPTPPAMG